MLQEAPYSINQAFATNPHYAKKKIKIKYTVVQACRAINTV